MAQTSMFWDGTSTGDAGPYSGDTFSDFIRKLFIEDRTQQGVIEGYANELVVTGSTSPIHVNTGAALVDGKFYENTASVDFTVTTPASTRIDRVVLRKDFTNQTIRLALITGTIGSGSPPALTQTDGTTWEIPLYQVSINNSGIITLTDERYFLYTANSSVWRADNDGSGSGLNADLLDDAHKSTDNTLASNSDYLIPSEKAIREFIETSYLRAHLERYNTAESWPGSTGYGALASYNTVLHDYSNGVITYSGGNFTVTKSGIYVITVGAKPLSLGVYDFPGEVIIVKNGNTIIGGMQIDTRNDNYYSMYAPTTTIHPYLSASDYVGVYFYKKSTDNWKIEGATSATPMVNGISITKL